MGWTAGTDQPNCDLNLAPGEPAQTPGVLSHGLGQLFGSGADRLDIICSIAQQGRDVADPVEFGIILHIKKFDVLPDDPWQNRFANIHDFLRGATADRTEAD